MPVTDDELLETVAVHINWLRRPNDLLQNRADALQSADYLERLADALRAALADRSHDDDCSCNTCMNRVLAGSATPTDGTHLDGPCGDDACPFCATERYLPGGDLAGSVTPTEP